MGKALIIISLASVVAIVAMAAMVFTSFDHRERVRLQQDVLATKTAESRDYPNTRNRDKAIDVVSDRPSPR